jgi:hypothetical protein
VAGFDLQEDNQIRLGDMSTKLFTDALRAIRVYNGKIIPYFKRKGKPSALSPSALNELVAGVNALTNPEIRHGPTDAVFIADKKVVYQIGDLAATGSVIPHPFKLYAISDSQKITGDKGKTCYAVRAGLVEVRSLWQNFTALGNYTAIANNGDMTYYQDPSGGEIGDDVEITDSPLGPIGTDGSYFALDDLAGGIDVEMVGGNNYGAYYAFWIEINDAVPNSPPTVQIKCRRFSIRGAFAAPGSYPLIAFPLPVTMDTAGLGSLDIAYAKQVIPLAILQLKTGGGQPLSGDDDGLLTGAVGILDISPANYNQAPVVLQILRDHRINRFDEAGGGTSRICGYFNPARYRTYYQGDIVFYYGTSSSDPLCGSYIAMGAGANPAGVISPFDNPGASFIYLGNVNPPSATNPP